MKLRSLAAACAAISTLAVAGVAVAGPITVKLAQPVAEKTKVIAGGAVFLCEGDTCYAKAATPQTYGPSVCKVVASQLGAVTAFGGAKSFDEARLAACNSGLDASAQIATR